MIIAIITNIIANVIVNVISLLCKYIKKEK